MPGKSQDQLRPAERAHGSGPDDAQTRSEADQTGSDGDQTAADFEQSASDVDQQMSDSDQRASDRDQATADADLANHPGANELRQHEEARAARILSSEERFAGTTFRSRASQERDSAAERRDEVADARDHASDERDRQAEEVDLEAERAARAAGDGAGMQAALVEAAAARGRAAADRMRAAEDRKRAALDRRKAARDRRLANSELEGSHLDDLTGAYRRGAGEVVLRHELERAQRTGTPLVFAFVDIDGLKLVNDKHGHAAGDELIKRVVATIASSLRPYDPLVRFGGDEFVCSLFGTDLAEGRRRFDEIQDSFTDGSITVGLTEMKPDDTVGAMADRGDSEMRRLRTASA